MLATVCLYAKSQDAELTFSARSLVPATQKTPAKRAGGCTSVRHFLPRHPDSSTSLLASFIFFDRRKRGEDGWVQILSAE